MDLSGKDNDFVGFFGVIHGVGPIDLKDLTICIEIADVFTVIITNYPI